MEKFTYMKVFKCDVIDAEFMKKYYRKLHVVANINYLFCDKIKMDDTKLYKLDDDSNIQSFDDTYNEKYNQIKKSEQKILIIELLNKLGYTLEEITNKSTKKLTKDEMETKMKELNGWFSKYNCQIFGLSKKKIDSIKSFLGALNTVLNNYGIVIKNEQKNIRVADKRYNENFYRLMLDDNYSSIK
jgi:hypothetical protein